MPAGLEVTLRTVKRVAKQLDDCEMAKLALTLEAVLNLAMVEGALDKVLLWVSVENAVVVRGILERELVVTTDTPADS